MRRIGVAFTEPRGPTRRRAEYGIFAMEEAYGVKLDPPPLYVRYQGYREVREDGEAQVGLAGADNSGARMAAHQQPIINFDSMHFGEVRWFKGEER
jgi:hypothetical protein